jgi:lactose/cellobiose-specific phosphotransferase system IIC component
MVLAPVVAAFLAQRLMRSLFDLTEIPSLITGISALINFMLLATGRPSFADGLGHGAMLQGIVMGILTAELLRFTFHCPWLKVNDKHCGSNSIYHHAIQMTPAVIVAGLVAFLLVILMGMLPPASPDLLSPIINWTQQLPVNAVWILSPIATLFNQISCFFGIHGVHILDTYATGLFAPADLPYTNTRFWRPIFNHYTLMGGAGATLSLVIAILIAVRQGPQSSIAKLSLVPAIFNINEAMLYGLPLVLNGLYLIPFLCVPLLLTLITVAAAELGWVSFLPNDVLWTTPPIISGWLLTNSWRGAALQIMEIGLGVAVYLPFVRSAETVRQQRETTAITATMKQIAEDSEKYGKYVIRHDQDGLIARSLLADLREAFKSDDGTLRLAYQPKHDKAGSVVGVEALIRWNHPLYGPISPVVMIALVENGLDIHTLGTWVFKQACECKVRWNAAGYQAMTMAVNVSPLQLEDFELTSMLEQLLHRTGLKPSEIELEITESAVLPDSQAVEQTLRRLAEMGLRLSMDDFGMGHSSLLYLRRFPVHSIKIDGSLTRDVLNNSINADIIRTIGALGQSQKVQVVAEYVETLEQREMLTNLGCDIFQGYYHSPALTEVQCLAYFSKNPNIALG